MTRVAVVGDGPAAADLVAGLQDRGHLVQPVPGDGLDGAAAVAAALGRDGSVDAAVWGWTDPDSTSPTAFGDLDEDTWTRRAERPVRRFLAFLQGAHAHFGGRDGAVVALVPVMSMIGAPVGLAPWATASEAQRALAKVAARNWGRIGLTVNLVAVAPALLAPGGDGPWQRAGLPAPSLPTEPSVRGQVAGVVATLLSPEWRAVTGATVGVDGGVWMAP